MRKQKENRGWFWVVGLVAATACHSAWAQDIRGESAQQTLERSRSDSTLESVNEATSREQDKKKLNRKADAQSLEKDAGGGVLDQLPSTDKLNALKAQIAVQPNNLDLRFAYGQMAAALGEYEDAAKTYESMLALTPDLPRVRLDLGAIYMRLGRFEEAQAQLKMVMDQNPPDAVTQNITPILAKLEQELSEHDLGGSVTAGVNFDTNGNSAPASGSVLIFDTRVPLTGEQLEQHDLQGFTAAGLNHTYRPQWARGKETSVRWKNSANYFRTDQSSLETLDLNVFTLRSGPEFEHHATGLKISPAAEHSHIVLNQQTYLRATTAELGAELPVNDRLVIGTQARHSFNQFQNSDDVSTLEDRTGSATQIGLSARYVLTDTDYLNANLTHRRERTRREYFDNEQFGLTVGYTRLFEGNYFASANVGWRNTTYDDQDALISMKTRHDRELSGGLTIGKQINETLTGTVGYQYRDTQSNILNYEYDNHRVSAALSARF